MENDQIRELLELIKRLNIINDVGNVITTPSVLLFVSFLPL